MSETEQLPQSLIEEDCNNEPKYLIIVESGTAILCVRCPYCNAGLEIEDPMAHIRNYELIVIDGECGRHVRFLLNRGIIERLLTLNRKP